MVHPIDFRLGISRFWNSKVCDFSVTDFFKSYVFYFRINVYLNILFYNSYIMNIFTSGSVKPISGLKGRRLVNRATGEIRIDKRKSRGLGIFELVFRKKGFHLGSYTYKGAIVFTHFFVYFYKGFYFLKLFFFNIFLFIFSKKIYNFFGRKFISFIDKSSVNIKKFSKLKGIESDKKFFLEKSTLSLNDIDIKKLQRKKDEDGFDDISIFDEEDENILNLENKKKNLMLHIRFNLENRSFFLKRKKNKRFRNFRKSNLFKNVYFKKKLNSFKNYKKIKLKLNFVRNWYSSSSTRITLPSLSVFKKKSDLNIDNRKFGDNYFSRKRSLEKAKNDFLDKSLDKRNIGKFTFIQKVYKKYSFLKCYNFYKNLSLNDFIFFKEGRIKDKFLKKKPNKSYLNSVYFFNKEILNNFLIKKKYFQKKFNYKKLIFLIRKKNYFKKPVSRISSFFFNLNYLFKSKYSFTFLEDSFSIIKNFDGKDKIYYNYVHFSLFNTIKEKIFFSFLFNLKSKLKNSFIKIFFNFYRKRFLINDVNNFNVLGGLNFFNSANYLFKLYNFIFYFFFFFNFILKFIILYKKLFRIRKTKFGRFYLFFSFYSLKRLRLKNVSLILNSFFFRFLKKKKKFKI